jgi:IS5 family transposase
MKAHIGIDVNSGLSHSFITTAANQHDLNETHNILHGDEEYVLVDSGCKGSENGRIFLIMI